MIPAQADRKRETEAERRRRPSGAVIDHLSPTFTSRADFDGITCPDLREGCALRKRKRRP